MTTHMTLKTVGSAPQTMILGRANPSPPAIAPYDSASRAPKRTKFNLSTMVAFLATLVTKPLQSIFDRLVPVGHEDETGFHYGEP